jgi:hypothetical protein
VTTDVLLVAGAESRRRPVDDAELAIVLVGLARRHVAARDGHCPCGGVVVLPNRAQRRQAARAGREAHARLEHEADCEAVNPAADRFLTSAGNIDAPARVDTALRPCKSCGDPDVRPPAASSGSIDAPTVGLGLRPCKSCGHPDVRPPAAFSWIIDAAARGRGWSDADLAAAAGISPGYVWRLRRESKVVTRPSCTVARRLVDALGLEGEARRVVLASARAGVGYDALADEAEVER